MISNPMFKLGDKVRCIIPRDFLNKGQIYTIKSCGNIGGENTCCVDFIKQEYCTWRFELVEPAQLRGLALQVKIQGELSNVE